MIAARSVLWEDGSVSLPASVMRADPNSCPGVGCILEPCARCGLWHCPRCGCRVERKAAA